MINYFSHVHHAVKDAADRGVLLFVHLGVSENAPYATGTVEEFAGTYYRTTYTRREKFETPEFGTVRLQVATEDRLSLGHWRKGCPDCYIADGILGRFMVYVTKEGKTAFINHGGKTVYGDGSITNPYRLFETLAHAGEIYRNQILQHREKYPSKYPYTIAGMDIFTNAGLPNPNRI